MPCNRATQYESEYGQEAEFENEGESFEFDFEQESSSYGEAEGENESEIQEMEAASSLMEVSSEQELDQFLGDLVSKAAAGIRNFAQTPAGQAVIQGLKKVAIDHLPDVGAAVGRAGLGFVGSKLGFDGTALGANLGRKAGDWAKDKLSSEFEGMSAEDREFEESRNFVKLGKAATRHAVEEAKRLGGPQKIGWPESRRIAKAALVEAAKMHAPALLTVRPGVSAPASTAAAASQRATPSVGASQGQHLGLRRRHHHRHHLGMNPGAFQPAAPLVPSPGHPWEAVSASAPAWGPSTPAGSAPPAPTAGVQWSPGFATGGQSGRWIRRGRQIILLGI